MIVNTSAIVAAVAQEPDGPRFQQSMLQASSLAMSSVTVLETRIVLYARYGIEAIRAFDALLQSAAIEVAPFDTDQAVLAFDGFRRFGKGQAHPAQLNIIDCAAYALAKSRDEPLLFKGGDFARTDVLAVL